MRPTSHFAGFTLIELMLTIVILAVLLAIAVPSFTNIAGKNRLKSAAERLSTEIDFARTQAIAQNRTARVHFATGASWCLGVDDQYDMSTSTSVCDCASSPAECTIDGREQVVTASDFDQIEIASTTFPDTDFEFDSTRGILENSADTGRLTFQNEDGKQVALRVNPLGRPSICTPSGGNVPEYPSCP